MYIYRKEGKASKRGLIYVSRSKVKTGHRDKSSSANLRM
jgi:hypothetical protein